MRDRYRPWIAALLALLIAGLGHAYLRRWSRALLWFVTILGGAFALTVLYGDPGAETPADLPSEVLLPVLLLFGLSAVDAFLVGREQLREADRRETVARAADGATDDERGDAPPASEAGVGNDAEDGGLLNGSNGPLGGDGDADAESDERSTVQCPHCGKETDADLDFCHWCTEPLPWADDEDDEAQKA